MTRLVWFDQQVKERICEADGCSNILPKSRKRFCCRPCSDKSRRNRVFVICKNCGGEKEVKRSMGDRTKFCSRVCQRAYNTRVITCLNCGERKRVQKSGNIKFCSKKCFNLAIRNTAWPDESGVEWKINGKGYLKTQWRKHPLANRNNGVLQHRHIVWEASGFDPRVLALLKNGAVVHHKNGKRDDNRIENLEILVSSKHYKGISTNDMEETLMALGYTVQKPLWLK